MSLLALKQHMLLVRFASLSSLCNLFKMDPENLRCLLSHWMRKGKIKKCLKTAACGSKCFKCPTLSTEIYEWVDSTAILN